MHLVKFTQSHGAYRGGETAGFTAEEAERLVDKLHVAARVDEDGKGGASSEKPLSPKEVPTLKALEERIAKGETLSAKDAAKWEALKKRSTVEPSEGSE